MNADDRHSTDQIIIGLVGGIASGKSTVARMIEKEGGRIVDADQIAHEALEQPEIQEQIKTEFGTEYVSDGSVNRSLLASVVFADEQKTKKLNALIHPYVLDQVEDRIQQFNRQSDASILVLDVPLLVEKDLHERCDLVLFLDAPESLRVERVQENRDWTRDELIRRESVQDDLDLKRQIADFIIQTDQSKQDVEKRVRSILSKYLETPEDGSLDEK